MQNYAASGLQPDVFLQRYSVYAISRMPIKKLQTFLSDSARKFFAFGEINFPQQPKAKRAAFNRKRRVLFYEEVTFSPSCQTTPLLRC
jgi:hypothetical protein